MTVDLPLLWTSPCWERPEKGLWSGLLCKLRSWLRAHDVFSDPTLENPCNIRIFWAGSAQVYEAAPRRGLLTGPEQAGPCRKAAPEEKPLVLWAAPHGTVWDFVPCQRFTWLLPMTDALVAMDSPGIFLQCSTCVPAPLSLLLTRISWIIFFFFYLCHFAPRMIRKQAQNNSW